MGCHIRLLQGAGSTQVLEAFDSVRGQHESVAAEDYNDDDAFKSMTNEART